MGGEWREHSLSEFISIKHGFAFKGEFFKSEETYNCLLTPGNFSIGGGFKGDKLKFYDGPVPDEYILKKDDLVVTMTDLSKEADTLGYSALVPDIKEHRLLHNQRVGLVEFKNSELDKTYLYFLLCSRAYRNHVLGGVTGTTVKHTSPTKILSYQFRKPSKAVQIEIGRNLIDIDNKIQLNRQTNETLEKMAQALFKSWFVDFDPVIDNALEASNTIPDELQDRAARRQQQLAKPDHQPLPDAIRQLFPSEFELTEAVGWVPMGWVVKKADDVADLAIGKTPPRKQQEWFSDSKQSNVVWVSIRDMGGVSAHISDSSEYLTHEAIDKFNVKVVPKGSVLLSFKLTLGRVTIATCDLTTNEAIAHFSNPKYKLSKEYIYSYLKCFSYEKLGSTSSIATAVNSKIIKAMPILVPSENVLEAFQGTSKCWFSRMALIYTESSTLTTLRDTLLPKLISGELRLPSDALADAEQQLADAAS